MERYVKEILIWSVIMFYIIIVLGFVSAKQDNIICSDIELVIIDSTNNNFIDKTEILTLIEQKYGQVLGQTINDVNSSIIEKIVNEHPVVKHAEIYKSMQGVLKIELKQENPVLRIINKTNEGYYLNEDGALIPISNKYHCRVPVANGNIGYSYKAHKVKTKSEAKLLDDLLTLSKFIYNDNFWNAQIEQIYVNESNEFELIPRVGQHIIVFGTIDNYDIKFKKLFTLYTESMKYTGWNKYKIINLKFENQLVCTKR